MKRDEFARKIAEVINGLSLENECNMPDWVIANYLVGCFDSLCAAKNANDKWHAGGVELDEVSSTTNAPMTRINTNLIDGKPQIIALLEASKRIDSMDLRVETLSMSADCDAGNYQLKRANIISFIYEENPANKLPLELLNLINEILDTIEYEYSGMVRQISDDFIKRIINEKLNPNFNSTNHIEKILAVCKCYFDISPTVSVKDYIEQKFLDFLNDDECKYNTEYINQIFARTEIAKKALLALNDFNDADIAIKQLIISQFINDTFLFNDSLPNIFENTKRKFGYIKEFRLGNKILQNCKNEYGEWLDKVFKKQTKPGPSIQIRPSQNIGPDFIHDSTKNTDNKDYPKFQIFKYLGGFKYVKPNVQVSTVLLVLYTTLDDYYQSFSNSIISEKRKQECFEIALIKHNVSFEYSRLSKLCDLYCQFMIESKSSNITVKEFLRNIPDKQI